MPNVEANRKWWDRQHNWSNAGEEWSFHWGGSEAQWYGSLYPRLHRWFPTGGVLEIAPGFGRWTKFLLPLCREYAGVELSAKCTDACRERFADAGHARFILNDGVSLAEVPDRRYDFVFSFDSLVHAEFDVFEAYVPQILCKLTQDGVAFIHHSNLLALPEITERKHGRAASVSGEKVAQLIAASGGRVLLQEFVNWGSDYLNDCLTLFGPGANDVPVAEPIVITNPSFMLETRIIKTTQAPWNRVGMPISPG